MFPYIDIFSFRLPTYGLISLVGVLVAGFVTLRISDKRGILRLDLGFVAIAGGIGLFIGAHLLYAITRTGDIVDAFRNYSEYDGFVDFVKSILEYFSGMVFYGGLYGGLGAGLLIAGKRKMNMADVCDLFAVFVPLFHIFGRIACFLAGCCYGVESDWGISGRMVAFGVRESTKRIPVQLIEAFALLLLFVVIYFLCRKEIFRGNLLFIYLSIYAVLRFLLEFLRGDGIRGKLLVFTTSQWISIITLMWVGIYLYLRHRRYNKIKE